MNDWSMLKKLIWLHIVKGGGGIERTVKGAIVHVINALARPAISVKCEVNPIQDLHGYDSPWPAGGGKQLYNSATFSTITNGTITCTNNGDGSFTFNADEADTEDRYFDIFKNQFDESVGGTPLPSAEYRLTGTPSGGSFNTYTMYSRPSYSNDTGNGVTFTNSVIGGSILIKAGYRPQNLVFRPMIRLASNGDDTYAPYSNICPISGRTSATVTRTGINIWDEQTEDGFITATGVLAPYANAIRSKNFTSCKPNEKYVNHHKQGMNGCTIAWYDESKTFIQRDSVDSSDNVVVTTPGNAYYFKLSFYNYKAQDASIYNNDVSINYPYTNNGYYAYSGTTYSITFPSSAGTVYGVTLDVTGGKMVVDRAMVDLGTLEYYYVSSGGVNAFRSNIGAMPVTDNSQHGITSIYPFAGTRFTANMPNLSWMIDSQGRLFIRDDRYTDISSFVAYLSGQTIVYELATPIEITLTPTQIDMLLGENNLWADAGDLTLTYYADGNASTSEALGILLGGTYNNPGGADDASDDEALEILLGGS